MAIVPLAILILYEAWLSNGRCFADYTLKCILLNKKVGFRKKYYWNMFLVNIGLSNGLLLPGNKPYLGRCWRISWRHITLLGLNELIWMFKWKRTFTYVQRAPIYQELCAVLILHFAILCISLDRILPISSGLLHIYKVNHEFAPVPL